MIDPGPPVLQAATLEVYRQRNPGIRALVVRGNSWEHLEIRIGPGGHPALKRRLVRQALAYGIDRGAIAAVALELAGIRGAEPEPLDSVVFLANSRYYQPNWKGYRYRPAHARRLLERAGCRRGTDGIYVCSGERLSLRFVTSAGGERRKRTLELAQEDLRGVGVDVLLRFVPPSVLGPVIEKGDFDVFQFGFATGATTAGPYDIFGCQRSDNVSGFCDRLLTRDLEQATLILGDRRRVRLLNRIDARLATAVPALPLFQSTYLLVFDASIRGVVQNGVGSYAWNAEDWWLDR